MVPDPFGKAIYSKTLNRSLAIVLVRPKTFDEQGCFHSLMLVKYCTAERAPYLAPKYIVV